MSKPTIDSLIRWASAGLVFFVLGAGGSVAMNFHNRISGIKETAARADEKADYALREVAEAKQLLMLYTALSEIKGGLDQEALERLLRELNSE